MSLNCAVYCRKSTEQPGVADKEKSVAIQEENARAFALRQGWVVLNDHVYVDDGISGAEFKKRPSFQRLLTAALASKRPPFTRLIVSEQKSIGREMSETGWVIKQLGQAGVQIFEYQHGRCVTPRNWLDKGMSAVQSMADEAHRAETGVRVHEKFTHAVKLGHVVGGRVFGYLNRDVIEGVDHHGRAVRSHVERDIKPEEAAVVVRIFELSAAGTGLTRIAKLLNAEGAPCPRPQQDRPAGWSPSTVRSILHRTLYRGEVTWNQTRKRDDWGTACSSPRPEGEWVTVPASHLRIVDDALWRAAHARLSGIRAQLATARGPRAIVRRDVDSRHLLSGFARCGECGGTLSALSRDHGRQRMFRYGCLAHHKRGPEVCGNTLTLDVARVDAAVMREAADVLTPAMVNAVIDGVFAKMAPKEVATERQALQAELTKIDAAISNLLAAIERGEAVGPLATQLAMRQREREGLLAAIAKGEAIRELVLDRAEIGRAVLAQVAVWRSMLTENVERSRQFLREVLESPIRFTRGEGRTYRFEATVALGTLIAAEVGGVAPPLLASPAGFEPAFWP